MRSASQSIRFFFFHMYIQNNRITTDIYVYIAGINFYLNKYSFDLKKKCEMHFDVFSARHRMQLTVER